MKILYLHQYFNTPSMSGGTRSYEMARRLVAWGHEVHMITTERNGMFDTNRTWHETEEAGIHVHWTPIPYSNKMSYSQRIKAFFSFSWRAAKKAVEIGGDVVFATSTPLTIAIPGVYASKRLKIPMVFEVRDLWPELPIAIGALKNPLFVHLSKRLERFAYSNSKRIVALSPGMKNGVVFTGYPAEKVSVIPNSCDTDFFAVGPSAAERIRSHYSWLGNNPLILYAGTLGLINGVSYLARLASETRKINPKIRFLVIGEGKEWDLVQSTARELGVLNDNFFLMKFVSKQEIPEWFSCATMGSSLFINLKEMWNNSANKFFDTLAAGKPIMINYKGWQKELLEESGAGISLDPEDFQKAASQLCQCITDSEWLQNASQAAKKQAQEFDRDKLAKSLEAVLSEACAQLT